MQLRRRTGIALAILITLLLLAAGCGGDDDTGDDSEDASQQQGTTEATQEENEPDVPSVTVPVEACPEEMPGSDVTLPDTLQQGDTVEIDSRLYYGEGDMEEDCEDVVLSRGPDYCSVDSDCLATGLFTGHDVVLDCFLTGTAEVANFNLDFREAFANDPDARVTDRWIKVTVSDEEHPDVGSSGFVSGAWLKVDLRRLELDPCQ